MASDVKAALGTSLTRAGTVVAYVTDFGGVTIRQTTKDVTNHQSPDGFKEYIGTTLDTGAVSLKGYFKPGDTDGQVGLKTDMEAHTLQDFVLTYPTALATTWTFKALVEEFSLTGATVEDAVEFTASLKISGKPTLGITASGGLTALTGEDSAAGALDFIPNFATGTYAYGISVATGITYVKLTPTAADHTITIAYGSASLVVPTGTESPEITLGAAQSMTEITITAQETGKAAKVYTFFVNRV